MLRTTIKLALAGFIIGMSVGNLITIIITSLNGGDTIIFSDALLGRTGNAATALAVQTVLSGVLGAIAMGGSVLYRIDQWPMPVISLIHYLIIMITYVLIGLYLGWIRRATDIIVMSAAMGIAYFILWLILYLIFRLKARELNQLIKPGKEEQ